MRRGTARAGLAALCWLGTGCFAPLMQVAERTAIEQELTNAALRRGVAKLDLSALDRGLGYVLQVVAPAGSDTALVRARVEERLASEGVRLLPGDAAGPLLRAVVPFMGVDVEATLLGVPFVVPGLPVALGDISLYRSSQMTGRARVEISVLDAGELAPISAAEGSRNYRNITLLTFVGPFRTTNLDEDTLPGHEERLFWELRRSKD